MKNISALLFMLFVSSTAYSQFFDGAQLDTMANSRAPYFLSQPKDLDFNSMGASQTELWVLNKGSVNTGSLVTIISNAGKTNQFGKRKKDGNAWHFMSLSTGLAFGENGNFATSPGIRDANHGQGGFPGFTGPALWSGDQSIFAVACGGCNGSHLDMLHASPYALGIAHEPNSPGIGDAGNVYWVFDGSPNADIARYDFGPDHGPGQTNHNGASVKRIKGLGITGQTLGGAESEVSGPPSHLVIDDNSEFLYACDSKNKRVLKVSIGAMWKLSNLQPPYNERFSEYASYNADWEVFAEDMLIAPSGIDLADDKLFITDNSTGEIIAYDLETKQELGRLQTAPGITGIKWGPDGNLWFVNELTNQLIRVSEFGISTSISDKSLVNFIEIYPNPSKGQVNIMLDNADLSNDFIIRTFNALGQVVFSYSGPLSEVNNFDWSALGKGVFNVFIEGKEKYYTEKIVLH